MSIRRVQLTGGPPWGLRITGGTEGSQGLKISRVNPGSKAAEKVREGDLISSINGKETLNLSNQEVQALLNATSSSLDLVLFNKRGTSEEARRRKHVAAAAPQAPAVRVRAECARLPLPASPEYIALKQTRQRRHQEREDNEVGGRTSEGLSLRPAPAPMSMSVSSEDDLSSSSSPTETDSNSSSSGRSERQAAWLRSIQRTRTTKTKMRIIKTLMERDYDSEPEPELSVDQQLESFLNPSTVREDGSKCSKRRQSGLRDSDVKTGKIENYQSLLDLDYSSENERKDYTDIKNKYLHEILATGSSGDHILKVRKLRKPKNNEAQASNLSLTGTYREVQGGGEIPTQGLARLRNKQGTDKAESSKVDYSEEKINIHYKTVIRAEVRDEIPEQELDRRLEEKMRRVYAEMERKKREKHELDNESRRHNDTFLPKDKTIFTSDYKDVGNDVRRKNRSRSLFGFNVRALYSFTAESSRELSFQKGNVLRVTSDVDDNWLRGEMGDRIGIFPSSYVEFIPKTSEGKLKARAKFNFKAKSDSELTMLKGEVLEVEKKIDCNWVEVRLGERIGIVPSEYLEPLDDDGCVSWGSTPSTPERPALTGVSTERLYRPTDLLKSKLREEFAEREKRIARVDAMIAETLSEFQDDSSTSASSSISASPAPDSMMELRRTPTFRGSYDNLVSVTGGQYFDHIVICEHIPRVEAELALCEGERVAVLQDFQDGWMAGVEKCSGQLGLFPASCVVTRQDILKI